MTLASYPARLRLLEALAEATEEAEERVLDACESDLDASAAAEERDATAAAEKEVTAEWAAEETEEAVRRRGGRVNLDSEAQHGGREGGKVNVPDFSAAAPALDALLEMSLAA